MPAMNRHELYMRQTDSRYALSDMPLLLPAIGMMAGIAVCCLVANSIVWMWVVMAAVGIVFGLFCGRPRIVLSLSSCLIGMVAWHTTIPSPMDIGSRGSFVGEVVVNRDYGSCQRCVVRIGNGARVAVTVYDYPYIVEPGDSVAFSGLILPPVRETTVPDEIDGSHFAMVNRISAACVVMEDEFDITVCASGLRGWLNRVRSALIEDILDCGLQEDAARFLVAVLIGEDRVDGEIKDEFARAGLSHILAISGTHVSTVIFLVAFLLFPVEMAGFKRWRILLMIAVLWLYALLTGLSPSVVRAVVMATFILVGKLLDRYHNSLNSLCGAALVILLLQPLALFMPGFQLSFLAVAGILMIMPEVQIWVRSGKFGKSRVIYLLVCSVMLPVAAIIATAPLSAWHFHYFPIWFLAANLPVALLLPLIIGGGVILVILTSIGVHVPVLSTWLGSVYNLTEVIARFVAGLPGNGMAGSIYFPGWLLLPIYAALFLLWLGWVEKRKMLLIDGVILLLGSGVLSFMSITGKHTSSECYVWRNNRGVAVICREGKDACLVTDAAPKYYPEIMEQAQIRLVDYFAKRGAVLIGVYGDSLKSSGVDIHLERWEIGEKHFAVVRGEHDTLPAYVNNADFLIVARGFNGDIVRLKEAAPQTHMILSPSLPPVRRKKYADELSGRGMDYSFDLPPSAFDMEDSKYSPSTK